VPPHALEGVDPQAWGRFDPGCTRLYQYRGLQARREAEAAAAASAASAAEPTAEPVPEPEAEAAEPPASSLASSLGGCEGPAAEGPTATVTSSEVPAARRFLRECGVVVTLCPLVSARDPHPSELGLEG